MNDFLSFEPQAISTEVLLEKYAKGNEADLQQVRRRIATSLASKEINPSQYEVAFFDAQNNGTVMAGRVNSAAGTELQATLINCFVQPISDSTFEDTEDGPSIYNALARAAETMRRGGGVGYDFSPLRPSGARVKATQSKASGPVSYMRVFDRSCETVESAGSRRGAQMAVLRCDHPDIEMFIHAKDNGDLTNFNISVGVTDAFMRAVEAGEEIELVHVAEPSDKTNAYKREDGKWVYRKVAACDLWDQIMRATYDHAEPGVLFLDTINRDNNLRYCESISATNPCAEQPLPPYGCCCLASINLTQFVLNPFTPEAKFDQVRFSEQVTISVRMLDNVLDNTFWPLEEQRQEAMSKRRIGLGYLGLGDMLMMMGLRYDSEEARSCAAWVTEVMRDAAYAASIELAKEKGPFPLFDADGYLAEGTFASRLPDALKDEIRKHGLRNSHLLSIAPTGTITLAFADNASNGIEPAFQLTYKRKKRQGDGSFKEYEVEDHAYRVFRSLHGQDAELPSYFVTALDISAANHAAMVKAVRPFVDSAISKTVNVPEDYPYEEFQDLYLEAWRSGLKGIATYRPNKTLGAVLSANTAASATPAPQQPALAEDDPLIKRFDSRPAGDLEGVTSKVEYWTSEGKKTVYLTVNFMRVSGVVGGKAITIERPIEFFMPAGQRNDGQQWITSTMRLLSMAARSGGSIAKALADMREVVWDKGPVRCGFLLKEDGVTKVPMFHDSEVAAIGYALQRVLIKRRFLDADANPVPVLALAARLDQSLIDELVDDGDSSNITASANGLGTGKKCPGCGANSVHKVDGCTRCVPVEVPNLADPTAPPTVVGGCGWDGGCG